MAFSLHFNSVSLVLILVALVFLILASISTPTVTIFKIASTSKYDFGIFGHCKSGASSCPNAWYPYKLSYYQSSAKYIFTGSTRDTLAKIFILVPISGLFNLISLIIVGLSHCLSTTVLIIALVTTIIAFITATISCIVVILAFYPAVAWTGWILVGAAAADLIAIPFLIVALKFKRDNSLDDDTGSSLSDVIRNGTVDDLTKFDDKFGHVANPGFAGPGAGVGAANANTFTQHTDETSSISKEYEYKVNSQPFAQPGASAGAGNRFGSSQQFNPAPPPNHLHQAPATKTFSNSSVYNSNPQLANDFTNHQKPSAISVAQYTNSSSFYEDAHVNLVNGPNTPISAKQQMAPNLVPRVATPTSNDAPPPLSNPPALPYPQSNPASPLNRPPYNPTNYSVFEHHPEVEGHKPFTELNDDDDVVDDEFNSHATNYGANNNHPAAHNGRSVDGDSDNDSDFTSVSQRAVNPKYNNNLANPTYNNPGYFPVQPQQQYPNTAQYSPQFQPVQQQQRSPIVGQFGPFTPSNQQPQQFYSGPQPPQQQPYGVMARPAPQQQYSGGMPPAAGAAQSRGPTISDNVLNNNPDFALGFGGAKRKPHGGPARPMTGAGGFPSASKMGGGMPGAPVGPAGKRANGLRDGPYGMLR